jgi:hypothetical protein
MVTLDWHGWRAALTRVGGRPPDALHGPAGIEQQLRAGVTHVGVPMHHRGDESHLRALTAAGLQVVRTHEPPYNVGRPGLAGDPPDLGRVLLDWESVERPGTLFAAYAEALQPPAVDIGWNTEHLAYAYPITDADQAWATEFWRPLADPDDVVPLRCRQFSLLVRLYQAVAQRALGRALQTFAYAGYSCFLYSGMRLASRYSVSWEQLARPVSYRGQTFPPLDFAVCGWAGLRLPPGARQRPPGLRLLHCIGLPVYADEGARWRDYATVATDRLAAARAVPGDGLALVACSPLSGPWNDDEDRLRVILATARRAARQAARQELAQT